MPSHALVSQNSAGAWHWEIVHKRVNGKRAIETVCPVKSQGAVAQVKARWAEIHSGQAPKSKNPNETFAQAVEVWREDNAGDLVLRLRESYELAIRRIEKSAIWTMRVREIEWPDIKRVLDSLTNQKDGSPLAGSTKRNTLAVIDVTLEHTRARGVISVVPKIPRGKKPASGTHRDRALTPEEDDKLVAAYGRRGWATLRRAAPGVSGLVPRTHIATEALDVPPGKHSDAAASS